MAAGFGSSSAPAAHSCSLFFSLSLFWLLSLFTVPLRTSPFYILSVFSFFLSVSCLSFLPSCLFYPLSLFIILDWACISSVSNANGAARFDTSCMLPVAVCSKTSLICFKSILHFFTLVESLRSLSIKNTNSIKSRNN